MSSRIETKHEQPAADIKVTKRAAAVFAISIGVITIILTAIRLFYGVDFTDESLYAVIPYRYVLGARPFVDELFFQQISTFFVYPWVKLFYFVTGGMTGLILYLRFVWLAFMVFVGMVVWLSTRRFVGWVSALLISLPCVAFIYFAIPALSYNTLGFGFLTIGFFIAFQAVASDKTKWLPAAGAAHCLAIVAYPTLAVAIAIFGVALVATTRKPGPIVRYVAGGLVVAAVFALGALAAGPSHIIASYRATKAIGAYGGGLDKMTAILSAFWTNFLGKKVVAVVLVLILLGKKSNPKAAGLILVLLPLAALSFVGYPLYLYSIGYISYLCLLGPVVFLFVWRNPLASRIFWLVWVPAFAAGLATAFTSSNGYWAAGIGFFPGLLATLILLWFAINELRGTANKRTFGLCVLALTLPVVILLSTQFAMRAYGDDGLLDLTARVSSGGFAGMYTTIAKRNYMENLERDLKDTRGSARTVMFFDGFPAGYLLTDLEPFTDWCWLPPSKLYPHADRRTTVRYYENAGRYPDIVVKMKNIYFFFYGQHVVEYPQKDPLNAVTDPSRYNPTIIKNEYTIYRSIEL